MNLVHTIAAFLCTLGVLIIVHEWGHYWVARRCGVKVPRFSIGFGRPLLRLGRSRDGVTEFVLAPIPLGGYVSFLHERDENDKPIAADQLPFTYERASVGKRIAIVLAGPLANLLLAILVYWGLNMFGVLEPRAVLAPPPPASPAAAAGIEGGERVTAVDGKAVRSWNDVSWLLLEPVIDGKTVQLELQSADGAPRSVTLALRGLSSDEVEVNPVGRIGLSPSGGPPELGRIEPGSPAAAAGLQPGDLVLEAAQRPTRSRNQVVSELEARPNQPLQLLIERGGQRQTITVTPAAVAEKGCTVGKIGVIVMDRPELARVRYGPGESLRKAVVYTWELSGFTLRMIGKMIVGTVSWKNISGPITIADMSGRAARFGLDQYLTMLALISISIGVLNLLPIPLLDGGHLLYYLLELITGSPPADWIVSWGQRIGFTALVLLTALALYNDISRLLL